MSQLRLLSLLCPAAVLAVTLLAALATAEPAPTTAGPVPGAAADQEPADSTADGGGAGHELDAVVVTATRREVPRAEVAERVQVIDRETIERLSPTSTGALLRQVTGTGVETGTGSGLPKRHTVGLDGLPASATLVLVDGVRLLSDHIHTGQNLELIPPELIERIEIIRGAASAQYGADAIGGVVNIVTRKAGATPEATLGATAGSYAQRIGSAAWRGPVSDHVRLSLAMRREESDGVPLLAPAHRIGQMGYATNQLLLRVDAKLPAGVEAFGWAHRIENAADWRGDTARSTLQTGVLGASRRFGRRLRWTAQLAHTTWEAETNGERNDLLHPETWLTWQPAQRHTLTAGADLRLHEFERTAVVASEQQAVGGFVQYDYELSRTLRIQPALRLDRVEGQKLALSPKASVLFTPRRGLRLRATVGRGFHAPTPQELYEEGYGHGGRALRFGNPDLSAERSTSASLGAELHAFGSLELAVYGYVNLLDDMIVPVFEGAWDENPDKDVWRRTNIGEARVWGAEGRLRWTPLSGVHLDLGGTVTHDEDSEGRQLPYHAGSSAFLGWSADLPLGRQWVFAHHFWLKAVFGRSAWSWKPPAGAVADDVEGLVTELADDQQLEAGVAFVYAGTYRFFLNAYNLLWEDIETLDDAYTVVDGEPVLKGGLRCDW